jgi:hypothetical protein
MSSAFGLRITRFFFNTGDGFRPKTAPIALKPPFKWLQLALMWYLGINIEKKCGFSIDRYWGRVPNYFHQ